MPLEITSQPPLQGCASHRLIASDLAILNVYDYEHLVES